MANAGANMDTNVILCIDDSQCTINLFGATVTSWVCCNMEQLFVSSKSVMSGCKAIRGGIPIVFPCFGPWEQGPQHGFARIQPWKIEQAPTAEGDSRCAVFSLVDNETTRAIWNHKFKLLYTVTLCGQKLTTELTVKNTDSVVFDFTCLLHTYFKVGQVAQATISGLTGGTYVDKVRDGQSFTEERDLVIVDQNEDRIYADTGSTHVLTDSIPSRSVSIEKSNLPDTVVWNPGHEKAVLMSDFGDNEYACMICVEAGHVTSPVILAAGQTFVCGQTLTASHIVT